MYQKQIFLFQYKNVHFLYFFLLIVNCDLLKRLTYFAKQIYLALTIANFFLLVYFTLSWSSSFFKN